MRLRNVLFLLGPMVMAAMLPALAPAAAAEKPAAKAGDKPALLGTFRDWFVYSSGAGGDRTCYALTQPKDTLPKGLHRDPSFFLISSWPARNVTNEPSVVPGYQYKDGAKTEAQLGSDKFQFFTKNDGGAGGAWMEDPADEKRLIDTMKRGSAMSIKGVSTRGTLVTDNFSLAGLSAALDKMEAGCK
jgi:hypothetical protein